MIWIVRVVGFLWMIFVGVPMIYFLLENEWRHAAGDALLVAMGWSFWHAFEINHRREKNDPEVHRGR